MAAYGLYSHIQSNRRRSLALLVGLFLLVYVLVYAGALTAEALSIDADLNTLMQRAWNDLISAAPIATLGTALWVVIAYFFHQSMIDALTGGRVVTRAEQPRPYNLLENLCISRGITMPKLKVMESDALNAFATGMSQKQYSITITSSLLDRLNDAEVGSVLGHELTHIRNGDVRMMIIAVIIAIVEPQPKYQLRHEGDDAGNNNGDDHHADVAVADMRQLMAEHRPDLGVVEPIEQA